MANNRIYPVTHHSMMELADHMYNYLTDVQWMDAQRTYIEESGFVVVQARAKAGKFKQILGLDKAITLRFVETPGKVNVEIGEAKWCDKAIVMTVSMFVLWQLAVTSGFGIYMQKKLINDLIAEMDTFMGNAPAGYTGIWAMNL